MAIPFFILAGGFLTHGGGVSAAHDQLCHRHGGHWRTGCGLGLLACWPVRRSAAVSGSSPATVVAIGSILPPAMVKAGFPNKFGRRHYHLGRPGHPDSARSPW